MQVTRCNGSLLMELDGEPPIQALQHLAASLDDGDRELARHSLFLGIVMDGLLEHPVQGDFLASYLQSLPAGSVERVEIIPNPSAAFEPDGVGGVINIVLKQNADRGLGGTLTAGTDSQGGYDATGAVTYGRGPWSLAATYGYRNDARPGGGDGFRINRFEDDPTQRLEEETDERARISNLLNLSADYALSRATTITSQLQLGTRSGDETELGTTFVESLDGTPVFVGCSDVDPHIPLSRVETTAAVLARLGGVVDARVYPGMGHTVNRDEIDAVRQMLGRS